MLTEREPATENNPWAKITQLSVLINGYEVKHPAFSCRCVAGAVQKEREKKMTCSRFHHSIVSSKCYS